jgi:cyclic pyranopterin phosphate synthase
LNKSQSKNRKETQPLKDSFNRRIDYLRVSVTDRCNLKCVYCTPPKGLRHFRERDLLTNEEIIRFITIALRHGLRKVRITGGEPLLRKNIFPLIASIKKTGVRELSLTTNGLMLSKMANELKSAGLDRVNISLDTLDAEKFKSITNGGNIDLVKDSISAAERAGLVPVKINMVPIRGLNDDEIVSFASLTIAQNCHVRFIEFMPANCDGLWTREKCVPSREVMERISGLGSLKKLRFKGIGPSRNYRINGAEGVIGIISPVSDHFCNFCNRLRLTANGKIRPCLFSRKEIDIRTPMRSGASDDDIDRLFLRSVSVKPEGHKLHTFMSGNSPVTSMSKIGG